MAKSQTPVLDVFSENLEATINKDDENNLIYFFREREINSILKFLLKKEKQHIAIVGEFGTGRETLVKTVAYKTLERTNNISLNTYSFRQLNYDALVAGAKFRGQLEERVLAIISELERNEKIVLYIKDLYTQLLVDQYDLPTAIRKPDTAYISHSSKQLLSLIKNNKSKIITCISSDDLDNFFKLDSSIARIFNILKLSPPNKQETIEIINNHIPRFKSSYFVDIPFSVIENVVEYSNLYFNNEYQPLKALSVLEETCAAIKLKSQSNPTGALGDLKIKLDEKISGLEVIKEDKNKFVKSQQYDRAADMRDKETKIVLEIDNLRNEFIAGIEENPILMELQDIVAAISNLTGVGEDKIRNKEEVAVRSSVKVKEDYTGVPQFEFLQAQSILHGHTVSIKSGLAFVLIPHNLEFDELYYHNIKPSLEHHGLVVLKADNIFQPGNILSQVWAQIRSAEVIIADVSGQNSNVIFELGLCYGIQRCPILLTRNPIELPFNIRNLRYIQYENSISGAHKLGQDLKTAVGEFLSAVRSDLYI